MTKSKADVQSSLSVTLKQQGYSEKAIQEILTWFDFAERDGVANF